MQAKVKNGMLLSELEVGSLAELLPDISQQASCSDSDAGQPDRPFDPAFPTMLPDNDMIQANSTAPGYSWRVPALE